MENGLLQDQLKSLKKKKEVLVILMFLFVIIIFWIGLSLFSSQQKLGISPEQKELAKPLTPNINVATLEKLEQKKKFAEFELKTFPVYSVYQEGGVFKVIDVTKELPPPVSTEEATDAAQLEAEIDETITNMEQ